MPSASNAGETEQIRPLGLRRRDRRMEQVPCQQRDHGAIVVLIERDQAPLDPPRFGSTPRPACGLDLSTQRLER